MDKFYGINRAEITAVNHCNAIGTDGIPVVARENNAANSGEAGSGKAGLGKTGSGKAVSGKAGSGVFIALRYGLCAALLLVCALGKFSAGSPLKEASGFIKDQLDRDIIRELSDDVAAKE